VRPTLIVFLLALTGAAHAQAPITLNLGDDSALPTKFVVDNVDSTRFVDKDLPGKNFAAGDAVQVLFESNGLVRIKKGNAFGWVPATALTDEAPAPPEPLELPPGIPVEGSN